MRVTYVLLAAVALLVAVYSTFIASREMPLARKTALSDYENFTGLQRAVPEPVWSIRGNRTLLYACADALGGRLSDLVPSSELANIASGCRDVARRMTTASPSWSVPYLVEALAAYRLDDAAASADALIEAQSRAPYAGWLSERRVGLALRLPPSSQEDLAPLLSSDIGVLLGSTEGRDVLVRFFVAEPTIRPLVSAALEDAPGTVQNDFLSRLRAAQATNSGS